MKRKLSETITESQNGGSHNQEEGEDEGMEVEQTKEVKPRKDNPPKKLKPFDVKVFRKSLKGTDFIFGEYFRHLSNFSFLTFSTFQR